MEQRHVDNVLVAQHGENARFSFNNTIKVVHSFFIDNFCQKAKSGRHLFQAELRSSAAFARAS